MGGKVDVERIMVYLGVVGIEVGFERDFRVGRWSKAFY